MKAKICFPVGNGRYALVFLRVMLFVCWSISLIFLLFTSYGILLLTRCFLCGIILVGSVGCASLIEPRTSTYMELRRFCI